MGTDQRADAVSGMTDKDLHDIKNSLRRLEIMAELLRKRDFSTFSEEEINADAKVELQSLERLFAQTQ